jgi:hypothetical protein
VVELGRAHQSPDDNGSQQQIHEKEEGYYPDRNNAESDRVPHKTAEASVGRPPDCSWDPGEEHQRRDANHADWSAPFPPGPESIPLQ